MELIFLLVLFAIGNLLKANAEKKQREQAERELELGEHTPDRDDLMEEIRRAMEGMRQQRQPEAAAPPYSRTGGAQLSTIDRDDDGFDEEDETLEEVPVVRSLEDEVRRPERERIDYDAQSKAAVQRRIEWAEVRARAHRPEDHRDFDRRIRAEPGAPVPAEEHASVSRPNLRQLVVWQEILGKPVALRERDDR